MLEELVFAGDLARYAEVIINHALHLLREASALHQQAQLVIMAGTPFINIIRAVKYRLRSVVVDDFPVGEAFSRTIIIEGYAVTKGTYMLLRTAARFVG